jgi:hypothetical protein
LHHEVDEGQEFLEFSKLIRLFRGFVDVEPSLTDLGEGGLDNLLKATYPTLLSCVILDLSNRRRLDLLEFFNT